MWVLLRRPLLLLFVVGCFVSIEASGRFSARLIADGMVSFAFVPIVEAASLALVWRFGGRRLRFNSAVDAFFATNAPWLLWIAGMSAFRAVAPPVLAAAPPRLLFWSLAATPVPVVWIALRSDLRLFQESLAPVHPVRALMLQRSVAWTCALGYFFGIAVWPSV